MDELVKRAKDGDQDAYTELYKFGTRYASKLLIRILWKTPEKIEDVAHGSVSNALLKLDKFSGEAKFQTWLHRVILNETFMRMRASKHRALDQSEPLEFDNEDGDAVNIDLADTSRDFESFEARTDLERILSSVPRTLSTPLMLHALEGRSAIEVSEMMGITVPAVKARILRGIREARLYMDDPDIKPQPQCVDCKKQDRFRFADTERDGDPLCRWCAQDRTVNRTEPTHRGQSFATKVCAGCGHSYAPTGAAQKFCTNCRPKKDAIVTRTLKPAVHRPTITQPSDPDMVTVTIPVKVIDTMWESMTPQQKAKAFEYVMRD